MNQNSIFLSLSKNALFNKSKKKHDSSSKKLEEYVKQEDEEETTITDSDSVRKFFKIKVKGANYPDLITSFSEIIITENEKKSPLLGNIEKSRFKEPTPVQMQTIPCVSSLRDVIAIAPTGSGKTASYLIPRLCDLVFQEKEKTTGGVHTLVIVPTHELADQIVREYNWLSSGFERQLRRSCVLTKSNKEAVKQSLEAKNSFHGLVVTTPLLLIEILSKLKNLAQVSCVIFDEADRLFETTFIEQTDEILSKINPDKQQRCMFSATMPSKVEKIANTILRDPIKITVGNSAVAADTIEQKLVYCGNDDGKLVAFRRFLKEGGVIAPPTLIFVESKESAREVFKLLKMEGLNVDTIHGERSSTQRDELVINFRQGKLWFLIATEVLARGLDFRGVNSVINWDLPKTPISYIHRIGRCGRAGRHGVAISFFTDEDVEQQIVRSIANVVKASGAEIADWVTQLKKKKTWKGPILSEKPKIKRVKQQLQ